MSRRKGAHTARSPASSAAKPETSKRPRKPAARGWWEDRSALLGVAVLTLVTALSYLPSLQNQFTNWDDDLYVTGNPLLRKASVENLLHVATSPVAFNYHPLTIWSLQANYLLSGLAPAPYILTNVVLHLVNGVFVFLLVRTLTRARAEAALMAALLFAVHPMHVESVAWISERKDLLYTLFLLLALASYVRYLREGARRRGRLLRVLLFSFLSLLSKPAAVAMPLLLLALDYLEGRKLLSRAVLLEKLPFLALSLVFAIVTLRIQSSFVSPGALQTLSLPERLLVGSYGVMMYLVRFVAPWKLSAFYPYPDLDKAWPLAFLAAPVVVALTAGATLWSRRHTRVVTAGMVFFLGSLLPVLQILSVGLAVMADRYSYMAHVGLVLIVAVGYGSVLQRWKGQPRWILGVRAAAGSVLVTMAILTFQRVGVWRTSETLWSDVIEKHPTLGRAYVSRGGFRMKEGGDLEGALRDLDKAVELAPDNYMSFYNRGLLYQRRGDLARALEDYTRAIAANPAMPESYNNRAGLLVEQGRYDAALEDYDRVVALQPDLASSRFNRAAACFRAGRYERALADYDAGLRLDPARAEEWFFRGMCERRLGRDEAALGSFDKAIERDPSQGRYYLYRARCLAALNRAEEAASDARRARTLGETVEESLLRW